MKRYTKYQLALKALVIAKHHLDIVVIGANDGATNDPIYDFAMRASDKTNVLLIEPNKALTPHLRSSYSSHGSHQIVNCAIGSEGTLVLYAVKQDVWQLFQPAYATGWPSYRAATGATSAIKSHVEEALKGQKLDPDSAIEAFTVVSKPLKALLDDVGWSTPIDVLQVDAEGYDDIVIYNSSLSYTRPKLIHFESHSLPEGQSRSLCHYLSEQRYGVYSLGGDTLAVDSRADPICISLNLLMHVHSGVEVMVRVIRRLGTVMKSLTRRREAGCTRVER